MGNELAIVERPPAHNIAAQELSALQREFPTAVSQQLRFEELHHRLGNSAANIVRFDEAGKDNLRDNETRFAEVYKYQMLGLTALAAADGRELEVPEPRRRKHDRESQVLTGVDNGLRLIYDGITEDGRRIRTYAYSLGSSKVIH